jgi:hypothetical protein
VYRVPGGVPTTFPGDHLTNCACSGSRFEETLARGKALPLRKLLDTLRLYCPFRGHVWLFSALALALQSISPSYLLTWQGSSPIATLKFYLMVADLFVKMYHARMLLI